MLSQILFVLFLAAAMLLFAKNIKRISRNIKLGRDLDRTDNSSARWRTMILVALGQSKMVARPVAGVLHIFVYLGFIIINIEVLEIIIDGLTGTHRVFSFLGPVYDFLIGSFEILAILVLVSCVIFLIRRNVIRLKRFWMKEMTSWPRTDANLILITEILLMTAFLTMDASDQILQSRGHIHYTEAGAFPISSLFAGLFSGMSDGALIILERSCWWFHIIGILVFLNYVPYSKHFHIFLAFPNTYYSNLKAK